MSNISDLPAFPPPGFTKEKADVLELNKAAEWYCGHEVTSEAGDGN